MRTQASLEEKAVSFVTHMIVLVGLMAMILKEITRPFFPVWELYFVLPNLALLLLYWRRSGFVRAHVLQALSLHAAGMLLGYFPYLIRFLSSIGVLGERWYLIGPGQHFLTAAWSLMAMTFVFGGLLFFNFCIDAAVTAATGRDYEYPFIGRVAGLVQGKD